MKNDHIKRMITLTGDNIKRLSLNHISPLLLLLRVEFLERESQTHCIGADARDWKLEHFHEIFVTLSTILKNIFFHQKRLQNFKSVI